MNEHIQAVPLEKAYRLLNHGPTVLVSARHDGIDNVMAAAWAGTRTRALVEASGQFVIQVPTVALLQLTHEVGTRSRASEPDKLEVAGVDLFRLGDSGMPFVAGCSAWLACRLVPEPHNQQAYDLFIGEVTAAWADERVFTDGHWNFKGAAPEWRSIHHIAGGHFYAIGEAMQARIDPEA